MLNQKNSLSIIDIIRGILYNRDPVVIDGARLNYKHAGVLIPLLEEDGQCKVLFTKRTDSVQHHKGQISFPGGAADEEDESIVDTVLRESYEEVGLHRKDVAILGRIDDAVTYASQFVVHPFVGLVPYPYDFSISVEEVDRLIKVPLSVFANGSAPEIRDMESEGVIYQTETYEYENDLIWGATARMMENFMDIVGDKLSLPGGRK